jgi:hypothetical protein
MGLLEVDSASGRVKRSLRGAEMFLPGSSAKLFSVSAVWKILGPNTRFTTPVYILGGRKGERVEGDLVLARGASIIPCTLVPALRIKSKVWISGCPGPTSLSDRRRPAGDTAPPIR